MTPEAYKPCTRCGEEKPLEAFYVDKKAKDGRWGACRDCCVERQRERRAANIAGARAANERWRKKNLDKVAAWAALHRSRADKAKIRASQALYRAIKRGEIVRPDACSRCGASGRIVGHHADYSKQLEVEWLCPACHTARHKEDNPRFPLSTKGDDGTS